MFPDSGSVPCPYQREYQRACWSAARRTSEVTNRLEGAAYLAALQAMDTANKAKRAAHTRYVRSATYLARCKRNEAYCHAIAAQPAAPSHWGTAGQQVQQED